MRVVHDAQHVAERVHDRRRREPAAVAVLGQRLVLGGAQLDQARRACPRRSSTCQCITTPPGPDDAPCGRVAAVDDPDLVGVVPDPELDVGRRLRPGGVGEVRLDTEQLGVPVAGGAEVVGEQVEASRNRGTSRRLLGVGKDLQSR